MEKNTNKSVKKATSFERMLQIHRGFVREREMQRHGEEHVMENLGDIDGVNFINNSVSVDVDSTWHALEQLNTKIIWIAGGVDKGNNYSLLKDLVNDKVDSIICLGNYNLKIYKAFQNTNVRVIVNASSVEEAVQHSISLAKPGFTVLFSPTCASYDMFENYDERGQVFKNSVKKMKQKN